MSYLVFRKVCGITNLEDAKFISETNFFTHIGFIFYDKSPRNVDLIELNSIFETIAYYSIKKVAVVVNPTQELIDKILDFPFDFIQFHGIEDSKFVETISEKKMIPYIKVFHKDKMRLDDLKEYKNAYAFLIDASKGDKWGGTGEVSDWGLIDELKKIKNEIIVAGGLGLNNLDNLLSKYKEKIWGIDLNSGVEEKPGRKSKEKILEVIKILEKYL